MKKPFILLAFVFSLSFTINLAASSIVSAPDVELIRIEDRSVIVEITNTFNQAVQIYEQETQRSWNFTANQTREIIIDDLQPATVYDFSFRSQHNTQGYSNYTDLGLLQTLEYKDIEDYPPSLKYIYMDYKSITVEVHNPFNQPVTVKAFETLEEFSFQAGETRIIKIDNLDSLTTYELTFWSELENGKSSQLSFLEARTTPPNPNLLADNPPSFIKSSQDVITDHSISITVSNNFSKPVTITHISTDTSYDFDAYEQKRITFTGFMPDRKNAVIFIEAEYEGQKTDWVMFNDYDTLPVPPPSVELIEIGDTYVVVNVTNNANYRTDIDEQETQKIWRFQANESRNITITDLNPDSLYDFSFRSKLIGNNNLYSEFTDIGLLQTLEEIVIGDYPPEIYFISKTDTSITVEVYNPFNDTVTINEQVSGEDYTLAAYETKEITISGLTPNSNYNPTVQSTYQGQHSPSVSLGSVRTDETPIEPLPSPSVQVINIGLDYVEFRITNTHNQSVTIYEQETQESFSFNQNQTRTIRIDNLNPDTRYDFAFQSRRTLARSEYVELDPLTTLELDVTPPTISGPNYIIKNIDYIVNASFFHEYFTAFDDRTGDVTDTLTVTLNEYQGNANKKGVYDMEVAFEDEAGNIGKHPFKIEVKEMIPLIVIDDIYYMVGNHERINNNDWISILINNDVIPNDTYVYQNLFDNYDDNYDTLGIYEKSFSLNSSSGNDYSFSLEIEVAEANFDYIEPTPSMTDKLLNFSVDYWYVLVIGFVVIIGAVATKKGQ